MRKNFLIIRLSSLGDIIHTLPAFAALRRNFPGANITWAVEPKGKEILNLVTGLNEIAVIDWKRWPQSLAKIRQKDQTAIDFQGLIKSAGLALFSQARERIGFDRKNVREPLAALFYTRKVHLLDESPTHVIQKNLALLKPLGVVTENYEFPLVLAEELLAAVVSKLTDLGFSNDKRLLVYNLGAAWETKRWLLEKWVELIAETQFGDSFPLLLWGNDLEKKIALAVKEKTNVPLSPFLDVQELMALLKRAALVISGDTFALQAACALGTPVVGLFGPTSPVRNGPFRPEDRAIFHQLKCNPCYKRTCSTLDCLKAIEVEEVILAVREVWKNRGRNCHA
ncbi:MAG: glycosyltransferase family 9 protein [Candidatus Aminicenantales bacterium]